MEEISITASTRVLQRIANRPLPAAKRLEIVISLDADDYLDTLGAANRIFEGTRAVSKLSLAIVYSPLPVTLEFIYRGLARLELCTDVSVDMMLGIIRGLPSLVELEVSMLSFGHASEDISVPEPGADCTVGLLDAQLERLEIEAARDKLGQDMLPDLIKYMMLAVPGLKFIRSHRVPRRPIAEFVDAYSKWHPHLAEIKLALSTFDSVAKPEPASIANLQ
ncbi:hypothetical protein H4R18_002168 [Coemansia javaensis]|uniref:Uncharacterized protein n=1 Tax=Coemansia javaensis TaxID=2761396 RepID=A0A9W8LI40_9FUNG|nr:hypothetical protein H4R18_002168 [Coemansia javaensis]